MMEYANVGIQIADSLSLDIEVTKKLGVNTGANVEGSGEIEVTTHGYTLKMHPSIVDSITYGKMIHVLVHVSGDLFLSLIADDRDNRLTLFVVDGTAIGLSEMGNRELLYNQGEWSRLGLFRALEQSVVAAYGRHFDDDNWESLGDGNSFVTNYITGRETTFADAQGASWL